MTGGQAMPDVFHGEEALQRAAALKLVHTDPSGWIREYLDEGTGQVWVLDYSNGVTDSVSTATLTYSNIPGRPAVVQTSPSLSIDANGNVAEFDDAHWVGNLAQIVPTNCGAGQTVTVTVTDSTTHETATFDEDATYWCPNNGVAPTLIGDFCCTSTAVSGALTCP